jgi:hypothetical protein
VRLGFSCLGPRIALHQDSARKPKTIRRRGHALITLAPLHLPKHAFQALIAMDGRTNDISIRGLDRFQRGDVSQIGSRLKLSRQADHEQV